MIIFNLLSVDIAACIQVDGLSRLILGIQRQKASGHKQAIFFPLMQGSDTQI